MLQEIFKGMPNASEVINENFEKLDYEIGENENGTYIRWENGLQICTHDVTVGSVGNAIGNVYRSGDNTWTFPKPFATLLFVDHTAEISSRWGNARGNSGTNASYWQYQGQNSGASVPGKLFAIGFTK